MVLESLIRGASKKTERLLLNVEMGCKITFEAEIAYVGSRIKMRKHYSRPLGIIQGQSKM